MQMCIWITNTVHESGDSNVDSNILKLRLRLEGNILKPPKSFVSASRQEIPHKI